MHLNQLLAKVVAATRARKAAEDEERVAKTALLTAAKLMAPEEATTFLLGQDTIKIKRRTTVKVLDKNTLLAMLGPEAQAVLEPSPTKVWILLSKKPHLMAKVLASGAIGLNLTEYVDVTTKEEANDGEGVGERTVPSDTQGVGRATRPEAS